MKKITSFIFLFTAAALSVSAQKKLNPKPVYVEWADKPTVHTVPREYKDAPAFYVINDQFIDYRQEGHSLNEYYTLHRIIKVLDDKGIVSFNKISIPVNSGTRVPSIQARTILPDGRVYEVTREMIKVTKDEHGRNKIVFAMEGVEKDAEIEILVKEIKPGNLFGSTSFQYAVPVLSTRFEMSYPKWMVFEEKGYNGFPDVRDTLLNNRRHISVAVSNIPAIHSEKHSFYDLYSMRCEYRIVNYLDENDNDRKKIYTWDDLSRELWNNHCRFSDKERKAVNKYLSDLGVVTNGNEFENIKKIENGIKNTIVLYPYMDEYRGEVLDSIIAKKSATAWGYIKLFNACFTQAGIEHEIGETADRSEHTFDYKFENWDIMENYLFYFPNLNKFLSPTSIYCRCPFVPEELLTTKGVFSLIPPDGITIGQLAEIKTVSPLPASESQENITAAVTFTNDMDAQADLDYAVSGYGAADVRQAIAFEHKNKIKELVAKIIPVCEKPEDLLNYSISNQGFDNFYTNKPVDITATVNAPQLTETAGPNYLFRLGDITGAHDQLYDNKERKLPLDISYPHSMNTTITVYVPKGYKILNPEAMRTDVDYVNADLKPIVSFKSDYVLKTDRKNKNGDTLVVTVKEFYSKTHYSLSEYANYKKVFNAAADFNKVALLMSNKKGLAVAAKKNTGKKKA